MTRRTRFPILIVLITIVIIYIQWNISTGNPNFHYGKDGGIFRMLESILFLGSTFFIVMSNTKRILFLFLGFLISLISSIIVYLLLSGIIVYLVPDFKSLYENVLFHVISCVLFITLFFYIEKLITKTTTTANTR